MAFSAYDFLLQACQLIRVRSEEKGREESPAVCCSPSSGTGIGICVFLFLHFAVCLTTKSLDARIMQPVLKGHRDARLLNIISPQDSEDLRGDLVIAPLDKSSVSGTISYTWGDPTSIHQLQCGGGQMSGITANADLVLRNSPNQARHIRLEMNPICSDLQSSEEKIDWADEGR